MISFYTFFALANDKTINIAVGNWPPFMGENLPGKGIHLDKITKTFEKAGYNVKYEFMPPTRSMIVTKTSDKWDATAGWLKTLEREHDFYLSNPVTIVQDIILYKNNLKIDSIEDLKYKTIGIARGYSYGSIFDKLIKDKYFNTEISNNDENLINKIVLSRVDAIIIDKDVFKYITKTKFSPDEIAKLKTSKIKLESRNIYLLFKKSEKGNMLLTIFNKNLNNDP